MTPETEAARRGIFTASEMVRLMSGSAGYVVCDFTDEHQCFEKTKTENGFEYLEIFEPPKGKKNVYRKDESFLPESAVNYVLEKCAEILAPQQSNKAQSASMQRGNDEELTAVEAVEARISKRFSNTGDNQVFFCDGNYGATPDGLMYDDDFNVLYGLEVKNPNSDNHLFNLLNLTDAQSVKKHWPEYYWQMMTGMDLLGCDKWLFVSHDSRFTAEKNRLLIIEVLRNEDEISLIKHRVRLATDLKNAILSQFRV